MKNVFLIINIIYCMYSLIILSLIICKKGKKIKRRLEFLCLLSLIICKKEKKIKRRLEFLCLLSLIAIINYYKKLGKTKTVGEEMNSFYIPSK